MKPDFLEAHNNLGFTLKELGRLEEAAVIYKQAIILKPDFADAHNNLGNTLNQVGRLEEAEACLRQAIILKPGFVEAHNNLGFTLKELGRLEEAAVIYKQAIILKPDFAEAHNNLGGTLQELNKLEEAEVSLRQAIVLKPDFAKAYLNLGNTLKNLGRLEEAEVSYRKSIKLKPDFADAHNNLGNTLNEVGRLEEAEACLRQAIILKPGFVEAHNNLGGTLQELNKLEEAEACLRQAIILKPDFADAHNNLGKTLYIKGFEVSALESIEKANKINPQSKNFKLLLGFMKARKSRKESEIVFDDTSNTASFPGLTSNILILNRVVEAELIANLYGMSSRKLDKTRDARYGSGRCSLGFSLFEDTRSIIKTVAKDLTKIMMEAVKSDVYIYDSFFNILGAGGGSTPHKHLNKLDKEIAFNLGKKKYSLVYYISVGDQNCSEPGILKLYDPVEDILPSEGMITIIPASRKHSAVYGGVTDRVMIGVNFYSL